MPQVGIIGRPLTLRRTAGLQPPCDLLGAPLARQQHPHPAPDFLPKSAASAASSPSCHSVVLRLRRTVRAIVRRRVSAQLPTQRRGTSAHLQSNAAQRLSATHSPENEVSFCFSEVVISHVCNPNLAGERKLKYHRLTPIQFRCCTSDVNPRAMQTGALSTQHLFSMPNSDSMASSSA